MTREEAIRILASSCIPGSKQTEALETLIPELAESEDERITDTIFNCLYQCCDTGFISGTQRDNALAWLEKQKDINCLACDQHLKGYLAGRKVTEEEKQKEQKPAEWSEEDERKRDGIIQWLHEYQKEFNPKYDSLSIESIESLIDWLKSLRPSWKPSEEHLSALLAVFNDPNNIGSQTCQLALTDLYEQLKKLGVKEEPEYYQHFDPDC